MPAAHTQQAHAPLDRLQHHCIHTDLQQMGGCIGPQLLPPHDLQPHVPLMHLELLAQQLVLQQNPLAAGRQLSDLTCRAKQEAAR